MGSPCFHRIDTEVIFLISFFKYFIPSSVSFSCLSTIIFCFSFFLPHYLFFLLWGLISALNISWLSSTPRVDLLSTARVNVFLLCLLSYLFVTICNQTHVPAAGGINGPTCLIDLRVFLRIFMFDGKSVRTTPLWNFVPQKSSVLALLGSPEPWWWNCLVTFWLLVSLLSWNGKCNGFSICS